jgi:tRNA 2-thiouridine synthesizing protein C
MAMAEDRKTKIMFICRQAPHGSIYAYEGLEVMLIFGAYEQEYAAVFMDDGVYDLKRGQDTTELGVKEFATTYRVMEDYGIETIYVDRKSLEERGLTEDDLLIPVQVVDREVISQAMEEQDVLLPF